MCARDFFVLFVSYAERAAIQYKHCHCVHAFWNASHKHTHTHSPSPEKYERWRCFFFVRPYFMLLSQCLGFIIIISVVVGVFFRC